MKASRTRYGVVAFALTLAMMAFLMPALFVVLAGPAVVTLLTTLKQFNR